MKKSEFFEKSLKKVFTYIMAYDKIKITNKRKEITMETLENKNCVIVYNPEYRWKTDAFKGSDLTDNINMPMFYNTTVRGHKKAWEQLKAKFNEHTTMNQAEFILMEAGIRTHSWCAMD